jgi:hypothetical protein
VCLFVFYEKLSAEDGFENIGNLKWELKGAACEGGHSIRLYDKCLSRKSDAVYFHT